MEVMKEIVGGDDMKRSKDMPSPNISVQILNENVYPCPKWDLTNDMAKNFKFVIPRSWFCIAIVLG